MKPRGRNPRLIIRSLLTAMRADLALSIDRWTVRRQIFVPRAERTSPHANQRQRYPWEWPEYRIEDWQILDRELGLLGEQIADARSYVAEQIRRLHCTGCGRRLPVTEAKAGCTTCEHCPADRPGPTPRKD